MTDALSPLPSSNLKRRINESYCEDHGNSTQESESDRHFSSKRNRYASENDIRNIESISNLSYSENLSPQFILTNNNTDRNKIRKISQNSPSMSEFGEYLNDGVRKDNINQINSNHNSNQIEQISKYYESQLLSLKTEYEMNINNKEKENKELRDMNIKLLNELQVTINDKKHLVEENNILKKAVSIQDNRYKEACNQNVQLNNVLLQAANCINELRNSRGDRCSNCCGDSYHSFPPPPPPDVY